MRHSILATLLAATALIPGAAMAQRDDDDRRGGRGLNRNPSAVTIESRVGVDQDRPERASRPERAPQQQQQQQQQQPQAQQQAQFQPQQQPRADRGDGGARADRGGRSRGYGGNRDGGFERRDQSGLQVAPASVAQTDRGDRGFRNDDRRGGADARIDRSGNGQGRGNDNRAGRPDWRNNDVQRGNTDWRGNDNRGGDTRWRGNDRRQDTRDDRGSWNRGWRQDNRYDWSRRRQYNRNAFQLPRYYAPSGWRYGYRRFTIGITLNVGLFNRNYWIDDADYYGLPEAYGPYRWVRYYNDALLVDVYSGQVVDTVYDIFW